MGLDCMSIVIVGEKLLMIGGQSENVVKYDCDTGKPYQTQIFKDIWIFENDKKETNILEKDEEFLEDFIHYCDYENKTIKYIGIKVLSTSSHRSEEPSAKLDLTKIEPAKEKYRELFDREPDIYVLTYLSY